MSNENLPQKCKDCIAEIRNRSTAIGGYARRAIKAPNFMAMKRQVSLICEDIKILEKMLKEKDHV